MLIIAVAVVFILIIAVALWLTGSTRIPSEMRQSYSPQDLEVLQEDLNVRKLVGQIVIVSMATCLMFWLIW
jgi:predicted RND superfamily exporter protein